MKRFNEETLIFYLRQGDKQAFQQLCTNYRTVLLGVITRIVKDPLEAEELLQDTYLKVWQRFHYYDPERGGLFSWLLRIAHNTALDALRRRKSAQMVAYQESDVIAGALSYLPVIDGIGVKPFVQQVLLPDQWQVVDLAYWQGYTHSEIADHLGWPLGTVKTHLRQSLIRLRPHFDCYDSLSLNRNESRAIA